MRCSRGHWSPHLGISNFPCPHILPPLEGLREGGPHRSPVLNPSYPQAGPGLCQSPAGAIPCPLPALYFCCGWAGPSQVTKSDGILSFSLALVASECHQLQPGSRHHQRLFVNSSGGIPPSPARACWCGLNTRSEQAHLISSIARGSSSYSLPPHTGKKNLSTPFICLLTLPSPSHSVNTASERLAFLRPIPLGSSLCPRPRTHGSL